MFSLIDTFKFSVLTIVFMFLFACSPTKPKNEIAEFYNYPNPFNSRKNEVTTYKAVIGNGTISEAKVEVYGEDGDFLSDIVLVLSADKKSAEAKWSGLDKNGKYLPASVYISKIILKDEEGRTFISKFVTSIQ